MDPQGYDAGKKVTGRKRHILVDTLGLLLSVAVHPADIQDRDGVAFVLNASTRALFPFLERIFADGGYQGPRTAAAAAGPLSRIAGTRFSSRWAGMSVILRSASISGSDLSSRTYCPRIRA